MVNSLRQTVIKANASIMVAITAGEPKQSERLPRIVGYVDRRPDPTTPGKPTMWLLAK